MLDTADVTRIISAWSWDPRRGARPTHPLGEPHLRLQVVSDEGDALAVEVAQGVPVKRDSVLQLLDRGPFEVAAVLRRQGPGGARVYLRLRAWKPRPTRGPATSRPRPTRSSARHRSA